MASALSVKELKEILKSRNVDFSDCFEKSELINRVEETGGVGSGPPSAAPGGKVTSKRKMVGSLETVVVSRGGTNIDCAVILCHGFGAYADDLAPIAHEVLSSSPSLNIAFYVPEAPLSLEGPSRAWWMIDMQRLMMLMMSGQLEQIYDETPEGVEVAREKVMSLVKAVLAEHNLPVEKLVLSGFSQGSMIAVDTALNLEGSPGALAVLSGAPMCRKEWLDKAKAKGWKDSPVHVLQTHGTQDMVLPFFAGEALRDTLKSMGASVDFSQFAGGHGTSPDTVQRFVRLIERVAKA